MKLDSIVYDYSSLQNAIAITLNQESPTFQAMYPSDTATSLVNVLASYGSMLQYQLVSAMANMYTDSAYSEAGIRQLAETLGNRLHGNISSEVYVNITRTTLTGLAGVVIPAGSKFVAGDLNFFNPEGVYFPLGDKTKYSIKLIQGELQTSEFVTSGISGEKIYFCEDFKCNTNLVKVFVNDEEWDITETFLPFVITDSSVEAQSKVVILHTDADGRSYIKFGNNSNGIIPAKGTKIKIEYVTNDGAAGNLNNKDLKLELVTPIYYSESPSTRTQLLVEITATTTASGGFNTQTIETLKESSPYVFASGQRAVRRTDYQSMLLNKCGYLTANVWGEYEEAKLNGGYDKIMMNMVYYTGIKSIQKYDLFPVNENLNFNLVDLQAFTGEFYPIDGAITNANGFLGSYEFAIKSYDDENQEITLKYRDSAGNGLITCDPSANINLINSNYRNQAEFEAEVMPINDISRFLTANYHSITTNQDESTAAGTAGKANSLITGGFGISTGLYNSQARIITYDNPYQIRLNFDNNPAAAEDEHREAIAAFAFKVPSDSTYLKSFPYKLAIYGTNDIISTLNEDVYNNVKNNSRWVKLTGVQTFNDITSNSYTDWVTTSVYSPNSTETIEEIFTLASVRSQEGENTKLLITKLSPSMGYEYTIKMGGITQPRSTYTIKTEEITQGITQDVIIFNRILTEAEILSTVLYGTLNDWTAYRNYVIEIYQTQANETTPRQIAIDQIKAIYKKSASEVNYNTNNLYINLPITEDSRHNKLLALPNKMQYYQYSVKIDNVNTNNNYRTGDVLAYQVETALGTYTFQITINSITNIENDKGYTVKIQKPGDSGFSTVLRGKIDINITNGVLIGGAEGTGGTITITSENTVGLYANYTGNYYTNNDIQAFDLPIINKYNHFTTYLEFKQPHIKNINIEINVEYENVYNYQVTKNNIINAINSYFEIKPNSMGATCNVSDIWKIVNSVPNIKRFNVLTPRNDIVCMPYELLNLPAENLIINDIINNEYK